MDFPNAPVPICLSRQRPRPQPREQLNISMQGRRGTDAEVLREWRVDGGLQRNGDEKPGALAGWSNSRQLSSGARYQTSGWDSKGPQTGGCHGDSRVSRVKGPDT